MTEPGHEAGESSATRPLLTKDLAEAGPEQGRDLLRTRKLVAAERLDLACSSGRACGRGVLDGMVSAAFEGAVYTLAGRVD